MIAKSVSRVAYIAAYIAALTHWLEVSLSLGGLSSRKELCDTKVPSETQGDEHSAECGESADETALCGAQSATTGDPLLPSLGEGGLGVVGLGLGGGPQLHESGVGGRVSHGSGASPLVGALGVVVESGECLVGDKSQIGTLFPSVEVRKLE